MMSDLTRCKRMKGVCFVSRDWLRRWDILVGRVRVSIDGHLCRITIGSTRRWKGKWSMLRISTVS